MGIHGIETLHDSDVIALSDGTHISGKEYRELEKMRAKEAADAFKKKHASLIEELGMWQD